MKEIDGYYFEDDFKYEEQTFYGVPLYCDGKHIYLKKEYMISEAHIGKKCPECGGFMKRYSYSCSECSDKKTQEKYNSLPIAEETEFLYSDVLDEYFSKDDWYVIHEYLSDMTYDKIISIKFEDLRIHPCEAYFPPTIDIEGLFEEAPEDFDVASYTPINEISECVDRANELLKKHSIGYTPVMSKRINHSEEEWMEIKKATIADLEEQAD